MNPTPAKVSWRPIANPNLVGNWSAVIAVIPVQLIEPPSPWAALNREKSTILILPLSDGIISSTEPDNMADTASQAMPKITTLFRLLSSPCHSFREEKEKPCEWPPEDASAMVYLALFLFILLLAQPCQSRPPAAKIQASKKGTPRKQPHSWSWMLPSFQFPRARKARWSSPGP